jgi:hypothetical protein
MKENKTKNKGTLDDNLLITLNITSIKDYKASLEFFVTNILYLSKDAKTIKVLFRISHI